MKHLKKLFALMLAFILALGIGTPAMALEEEDTFRVITGNQRITLPYGSEIDFGVELYLPEGWTVEYEWWSDPVTDLTGATGPTMHFSPGDAGYPVAGRPYESAWRNYYCSMLIRDEAGDIATAASRYGVTIWVAMEPEREMNTWDKIKYFFDNIDRYLLKALEWIFFWPILLLF